MVQQPQPQPQQRAPGGPGINFTRNGLTNMVNLHGGDRFQVRGNDNMMARQPGMGVPKAEHFIEVRAGPNHAIKFSADRNNSFISMESATRDIMIDRKNGYRSTMKAPRQPAPAAAAPGYPNLDPNFAHTRAPPGSQFANDTVHGIPFAGEEMHRGPPVPGTVIGHPGYPNQHPPRSGYGAPASSGPGLLQVAWRSPNAEKLIKKRINQYGQIAQDMLNMVKRNVNVDRAHEPGHHRVGVRMV